MKLNIKPRKFRLITIIIVFFLFVIGVSAVAFNGELSQLERHFQKQRVLNECFIGGPAPEIIGRTQSNQIWALSAFRGKVVVIDFTANGCPPCGPTHEMLASLEREFQRDDLIFVSVSVDETPELRDRAVRRRNIYWPVIWDEGNGDAEHPISSRYRVFELPSVWIIGRDGTVIDANALRFRPFLRSTIANALKS